MYYHYPQDGRLHRTKCPMTNTIDECITPNTNQLSRLTNVAPKCPWTPKIIEYIQPSTRLPARLTNVSLQMAIDSQGWRMYYTKCPSTLKIDECIKPNAH